MRKLVPIIFVAIFTFFVAGSIYHSYACAIVNCPYDQLVSKLSILKSGSISVQQFFILLIIFISINQVHICFEGYHRINFPRGPPETE